MPPIESVIAAMGGAIAAFIAAWASLSGRQSDALHLSEVEFRKALLVRIAQLERQVNMLEAEIARLRRRQAV